MGTRKREMELHKGMRQFYYCLQLIWGIDQVRSKNCKIAKTQNSKLKTQNARYKN